MKHYLTDSGVSPIRGMRREFRPNPFELGDKVGVGCMYVVLDLVGDSPYLGHVMAAHDVLDPGYYGGRTSHNNCEVRVRITAEDTRVEWLLFGLPVKELTWLNGEVS